MQGTCPGPSASGHHGKGNRSQQPSGNGAGGRGNVMRRSSLGFGRRGNRLLRRTGNGAGGQRSAEPNSHGCRPELESAIRPLQVMLARACCAEGFERRWEVRDQGGLRASTGWSNPSQECPLPPLEGRALHSQECFLPPLRRFLKYRCSGTPSRLRYRGPFAASKYCPRKGS